MVWIAPLPSTDSTMPMCSFHTIRSPGWGCAPRGSALPLCCAHEYSASTEPKPWPFGPTGTPDWRATQEAKYAHHGPGPGAPAVALRYSAIRGELFEPGGDSRTPTSPAAVASIFCDTLPPPPGITRASAPLPPAGAIAPCSIDANCDGSPDVALPEGALAGAGGVVGAIGGASTAFSSEMRAMTV